MSVVVYIVLTVSILLALFLFAALLFPERF
jgi:K+-transporting ATPase KdpF subunit